MIEERERIKEGEEKKIWEREREREREREKRERIGEVKREKGGREKIYFKWKRREIEIKKNFFVTLELQ